MYTSYIYITIKYFLLYPSLHIDGFMDPPFTHLLVDMICIAVSMAVDICRPY